MFSGYVRTMPLGRAVSLTFEPDNLCSICRMVKDAKQQQDQSGIPQSGSASGKAPLVFQAAQKIVVEKPASASWRADDPTARGLLRAAPPIPPPRVAAA